MSSLVAVGTIDANPVGRIHGFARTLDPAGTQGREKREGTGQIYRPSRERISRTAVLLAALIMAVTLAVGRVDAAGRTVRVGVYQNEPKIFMDSAGQASGIYIDLLDEISVDEGWTLVYVPCQWADCLSALGNGQIDLMPDVAYSTDRAQIYDFNTTPVLTSWSQVYANPRVTINGYGDLAGKRVAVLDGSIQQTVFGEYMSGFGFKVTIVPTASLEMRSNWRRMARWTPPSPIISLEIFSIAVRIDRNRRSFFCHRRCFLRRPKVRMRICSRPSTSIEYVASRTQFRLLRDA